MESEILIENTVFSNLSPLQQRILLELAAGPLNLSQLSSRTGSTVYTLGKQLSLLQFRTKYNPLERKGVKQPLVKKDKVPGKKTTYQITSTASSILQ